MFNWMKNTIMKKVLNIFIIALMPVLFTQCETTELDLSTDPNAFAPEDAKPRFLLNTIQYSYSEAIEGLSELGSRLTRIKPMQMVNGDGTYADFIRIDPITTQGGEDYMNDLWLEYYTRILPNGNVLEENAANSVADDRFHVAIFKIIKAHIASVLVDYYAKIPYSQASNLLEFPNPDVDSGEDVYQACFTLLNEAIALLEAEPTNRELDDLFYGGDHSKWIKFANSLKLRMYKNTGDTSSFNAIINSGNFISSIDDDMQYNYEDDDFDFAPDFNNDYRGNASDVVHKSNWLMNTMLRENDPRIRYYFYRQSANSYGVEIPGNNSIVPCSEDTPPTHYAGFVYCAVGQGYNGRSHGHIRVQVPATDLSTATLTGVYPFAGRFDDDRFETIGGNTGTGGAGKGIKPILLASDVDFWRGQMASNTSEKATFLRAAMEKSIAKVRSFSSEDPDADLSFAPSSADVSTYINNTVNAFSNATGDNQENIFAEQYFISMYGHGIEAYNYYRKTGYPTTLAPTWNPNPGPFPRSLSYPTLEALENATIDAIEKQLTDQVFWDTNPSSPAFPIAN